MNLNHVKSFLLFISILLIPVCACESASYDQGWVGSRAGGFEAEAEAMTVIGSRDQSRSQWFPF